MLPELYEPFELVQIRVLPFSLMDNDQMVRFKLESELVAVNSVGESFLFPVRICTQELTGTDMCGEFADRFGRDTRYMQEVSGNSYSDQTRVRLS